MIVLPLSGVAKARRSDAHESRILATKERARSTYFEMSNRQAGGVFVNRARNARSNFLSSSESSDEAERR